MPHSHRDLLQLASRDQHLGTLMSRQNEEHCHLQDQARVAVGKNEMHQTTGSINATVCMLQIIHKYPHIAIHRFHYDHVSLACVDKQPSTQQTYSF